MSTKKIVITAGDPNGIGSEVLLKGLTKEDFTNVVVIGSIKVLEFYRNHFKFDIDFNVIQSVENFEDIFDEKKLNVINVSYPFDILPGKETTEAGNLAINCIDLAIDIIKRKLSHVLFTLPISKASIAEKRENFIGHTEYLANAFNINDFSMMLMSEQLKVVLVTTHIPVNKVNKAITGDKIACAIRNAYYFLSYTGNKNAEIAVCGLNPHAGEHGTIGAEENEIILPAIKNCQRMGILVSGPYSADTIFCSYLDKRFGAYVAMYHDQGLIPLKLLSFGKAVNMTLGLPFHRISVDHGTAFDIAGKGLAKIDSFIEALKWAYQLNK